MTANANSLTRLHELLAEELCSRITGLEVEDDEGKTKTLRASAAELSVAAAFLKNNNITATPSEDNAIGELKKLMESKRARKPLVLADSLADLPAGMH